MSVDEYYGARIQKILAHPRYGPAMEDAVSRAAVLVLDYHSHRGDDRFCVSISERQSGAIELLDVGLDNLRELVHIEGFGQGAKNCLPLCSGLSRALTQHYGLASAPLVYLYGGPVSATSGPATSGPPPTNGGGTP